MTFILILVIQVQNLTFHWRHRTDVSGCKIGEGRSSLNLSKCQNLYQKMKLRVNQPAPAISNILKIPCSNTILIEEFLKMTVQIFKAMSCDKVSWLQSPGSYVVTRETERRKVRSHGALRVTGNISGWLLNWKQDTFLDTVFIMDVRTGPYLHSQSTQSW